MRLFRYFLILLIVTAGIFAFELSGSRAYPAGADRVEVAGTVRDPDYDPARWHTLSVGSHGRTGLSDFTAHFVTDVQWESVGQVTTPLGLQLGLVKEEDVEGGDESVLYARDLSSRWAQVPPDYTSTKKWTVGSSGGLMLALAFLDSQTPGDLSGGLTVSGSGVLDNPKDGIGRIDSVEGLSHKIVSAEWVKSDLILVPYEDDTEVEAELAKRYTIVGSFDLFSMGEAQKSELLAQPGPLVVRVPSFAFAVEALQALGGSCSCGVESNPKSSIAAPSQNYTAPEPYAIPATPMR